MKQEKTEELLEKIVEELNNINTILDIFFELWLRPKEDE